MSGIILNIPDSYTTYKDERAAVAYKNLLTKASDFTVSSNSGDRGFLVDGMTTTSWSSSTGANTITFSGSPVIGKNIDCVAFSPSNWNAAGCSIKIDIESVSGTETVINSAGFRDNAPVMVVFDERQPISITITLTTTSTLYLTGLLVGKSMRFPTGVSVGYQPGRWSTDNQVNTFRTESNAFGQSTVFARGSTESFSVENIDQDFMNSDWRDFIDNAQGKQIWFAWDFVDNDTQVMYGNWEANKPGYDSSTFSSVNLTIQGLAS